MKRQEAEKHAANYSKPMLEFNDFLRKVAIESIKEDLANAQMWEDVIDRWGQCVHEMKKALADALNP